MSSNVWARTFDTSPFTAVIDVSNRHNMLVDVSTAKQMTFTVTREELRERLAQLVARGATGIAVHRS